MTDPATRAEATCSVCQAPTGRLPFCPRDGTLIERFSVGERYQIEELIGGGGYGFVFGARHALLGKPIAVKLLRPDYNADELERRRFLREARMASQLGHENIVGILDFGFDTALGVTYLAMERLWGATVADLIRDRGRVAFDRALPILLQVARALEAAHAAGVVHRDLNPRNIMLVSTSGRDDMVKLCDFGLSRMVDGGDRVTANNIVIGTPAYMAPEQIRGDADQDHRVDLHAFGITAYELLTGRRPIEAPTPVAMIARKLSTESEQVLPMQLDDVPVEVDELIVRCLARDPADRPASAAELIAVLSGGLTPRSAPRDASLVGQRVGSYQITRLIETGGIGAVYAGEHPLIGTKVAVKVLKPEMAAIPGTSERFIQEARASSQIASPHMTRYHDFGHLPNGQPYAVMELLEGETLADRVDRAAPLPIDEVADIVSQLASVLGLAHEAGLVHRDIKPANVFLTRAEDGRRVVKLLDFGIAKALTTQSGAQTAFGIMVGTPFYCAPEQAMGQAVGPAADVYALGATTFEMLSGRLPFEGDVTAILGAKTCREAPSLRVFRPDLPAVVIDTVADLLARDEMKRLPTMAAVSAAMERWAEPQVVREVARPRTASEARVPVERPSELHVELPARALDSAVDHERARVPRRRWWIPAVLAVVAATVVVVRARTSGPASTRGPATIAPATSPPARPAAIAPSPTEPVRSPAVAPVATQPSIEPPDQPVARPTEVAAPPRKLDADANKLADRPPGKPDVAGPKQRADKPPGKPDVAGPKRLADKPSGKPDVAGPKRLADKPSGKPDVAGPKQLADKPPGKPDLARQPKDRPRGGTQPKVPDKPRGPTDPRPPPNDGVLADPFKDGKKGS